jgi:hypothetical protein
VEAVHVVAHASFGIDAEAALDDGLELRRPAELLHTPAGV